MRTATLNISKIITLIEGSKVTSEKMGSFEDIIKNFKTIVLTGMAKPSKFNKYKQMLLNNGFEVTKTYWFDNAGFEGKNSDVMNFRIEFKSNTLN